MKQTNIYGAECIDANTIEQFELAMDMSFSAKGALMPDGHYGYTMPIGGVIATRKTVVPSWVGYDQGCGVLGIETTYNPEEVYDVGEYIMDSIVAAVPMGFSLQDDPVEWPNFNNLQKSEFVADLFTKNDFGYKAIGTLGGGNHFIEISVNPDDNHVWIVVHSGSRGVGWKTAQHYMQLASPTGKASEGSYGFHDDSDLGTMFIMDEKFSRAFALVNRWKIVQTVEEVMSGYIEGKTIPASTINRSHNHVRYDMKSGYWIHRKGATHAELNMMGIIPGNMRDGCFIVRGKGCEGSLCSASHGAGRTMSRKSAKQSLSHTDFVDSMKGIHAFTDESLLDESPDAYKPIKDVMQHQEELVEVVSWLQPLINLKA